MDGEGPSRKLVSFGAKDGSDLGSHDLDGDTSVVPQVSSQVHRRHAAATDLAVDRVGADGVRCLAQWSD